MALCALIIKARLGLTEEELVEQAKDNPYLQFFIGLETFQYSVPFDLSMMVSFCKRLPESVVNDCNERIVCHGQNVIRSAESDAGEDDDNANGMPSSDQPVQAGSVKASSSQGTLLIGATCVPADIRYPTDLSLAIKDLGLAHQGIDLLIELVLSLEHPLAAHGFLLAGIGLNIGAIQCHMTQAHHLGLLREPEDLNVAAGFRAAVQIAQGEQVATAESLMWLRFGCWLHGVPLREDAHRYREDNGVQVLATLFSLAINVLRLDGNWSITEGIAALAHDIKGLLQLIGWREPAEKPTPG